MDLSVRYIDCSIECNYNHRSWNRKPIFVCVFFSISNWTRPSIFYNIMHDPSCCSSYSRFSYLCMYLSLLLISLAIHFGMGGKRTAQCLTVTERRLHLWCALGRVQHCTTCCVWTESSNLFGFLTINQYYLIQFR